MLKIGLIGVGKMGEYHAKNLKEISQEYEVEFSGIYDINNERSNFISSKYNIHNFYSLKEILNHSDIISCAASTINHYELGKKVLLSGKHLLIEKPFTHSLKYAEELANIAKQKNLIIQVGHVERFKGGIIELQKQSYDDLISISSNRLNLYRSINNYKTGVILDLMIHDIDIVLNIAKSDISYVDASAKSIYTDFEDFAHALLVFKNGITASLTSTRNSFNQERNLTLLEKDKTIKLNYDSQELSIYSNIQEAEDEDHDKIHYHRGAFVSNLKIHTPNALKEELLHFIRCCENKEKPKFSTENDLEVLSIAFQILDKAKRFNDFKLI